jgi:hypothetical protein
MAPFFDLHPVKSIPSIGVKVTRKSSTLVAMESLPIKKAELVECMSEGTWVPPIPVPIRSLEPIDIATFTAVPDLELESKCGHQDQQTIRQEEGRGMELCVQIANAPTEVVASTVSLTSVESTPIKRIEPIGMSGPIESRQLVQGNLSRIPLVLIEASIPDEIVAAQNTMPYQQVLCEELDDSSIIIIDVRKKFKPRPKSRSRSLSNLEVGEEAKSLETRRNEKVIFVKSLEQPIREVRKESKNGEQLSAVYENGS